MLGGGAGSQESEWSSCWASTCKCMGHLATPCSGSQLLLARPEIFNFMPLICLPRVKDRLEDFK